MKLTTPWLSRALPSSKSTGSSPSRRRTRDHLLHSRPRFDTLEGRQLLSGVFTVSNTNDSGPGSLRAAILASNATSTVSQPINVGGVAAGATTPFNIIQFSLPAGSTISPLSPLPAITEPVETFAPININASGITVPTIALDGSKAGAGSVGLDIQSSGSNITDLAIDNFSGGAVLFDGPAASGNWIGNDYIGLNLAGNAGAGNGTFGVEARGGASGNYISGDVISSNSGNGVVLTGSGTSNNSVQNDLIGTDATGSFALGNGGSGVVINLGATGNTLSGDVISGNGYFGVYISDSGTSYNVVSGSDIGTSAAASTAVPNCSNGVYILNSATSNTIGSGDVISGNLGNGVVISGPGTSSNVVTGDLIGVIHLTAGASPNGTSAPNPQATTPLGNHGSGVDIVGGASGNTVGSGDVISANAYYGVYLSDPGTSHNTVAGDLIGTNGTGYGGSGNGVNGVEITSGASSNIIGGTTTSARDVISANGGTGVVITGVGSTSNVVEGDYIGTDASGSFALGNAVYGVILSGGASNNDIGTTQPGAGDVISGNQYGVLITDAGTILNWVEGDLIGTNAADTYAVGNYYGVEIVSGASSNAVYSDVISGNAFGVLIFSSNTTGNFVYFNEIGTNASGSIAIGNSFVGVDVYGSSGNYIVWNTIAYSGYYGIINGSSTNTYAYNTLYSNSYMNMLSY